MAFIVWQRELTGKPEAVNARFFQATAYPGTSFFRHSKVQARLAQGFGLSFDSSGEAVCDDALLEYVLALDDADKVIVDKNGDNVYYGEMAPSQFRKCTELINAGELEEVLCL